MFAHHLANSPMVLKRKTTIGQAAKVDERQSQHLSEARYPPLTPPQRPEKALWLSVSLFGGGSMSELAVAREGARRLRPLLKKIHRQKPRKPNRGIPRPLTFDLDAPPDTASQSTQNSGRAAAQAIGGGRSPTRRGACRSIRAWPLSDGRKSGAIDCGEQSAHERPRSWRAQRCRI
jgi:hypothetical protein